MTDEPNPSQQRAVPQAAQEPGAHGLQAHSNDRVYQAAGDQYIYHQCPPAPASVSNTLPRGTAAFQGRTQELRALVEQATEPDTPDGLLPVQAIDGMPGVGKTALAVHAGHLLAHRFPDGQFFINLHAHTAGKAPVRPGDALFALLTADGVDGARIPSGTDQRAALWRQRLAGRRALLILDNAAERSQVADLLPGSANCLVMVTSRRRLTGLGAHHAAVRLSLGTLPADHSARLFAAMAARSSESTEAAAVDELVRLCGYLPLAICLLGAKLRPEPKWRVADMARELGREKHRLSQMRADDVTVAAAFDLSYRRLPSRRRRFFRRLGLHPGIDVDRYAAAALDNISPAVAEQQLDALYHDGLLNQSVWGRYRMHDLIGEFARQRADLDPERDRHQATARMLDYYQHGAERAGHFFSRPGKQRVRPPSAALTVLPDLSTRQRARAWMDKERANLFACANALPAGAEHQRVIAFSAATAAYLRDTGPWEHAVRLHRAAAAEALRTGDRAAQADALCELGIVLRLTGKHGEAADTLHQALEIHRQLGSDLGVADTLTQLAGAHWRSDDGGRAAQEFEQALGYYQELGDLHGQADVLDELGVVRFMLHDLPGAIRDLQRSLAIHEHVGDLRGQANALIQLGAVQQHTEAYPPVIRAHERALAIFRGLGDRHGQARALNYLGSVLIQAGDHERAEAALVEALTIHRELGYRLGQANALNYLGRVHCQLGQYDLAGQEFDQALSLHRELGAVSGQADVLNWLGAQKRLIGDHRGAKQDHDAALELFQQLGNHLGQAEVLNNLGRLFLTVGEPAEALVRHQQALQLAGEAPSPREEAHSWEGIGRCALFLGDTRRAAEGADRAKSIYQNLSAPHAADRAAALLADIARSASSSDGDGHPTARSVRPGVETRAARPGSAR